MEPKQTDSMGYDRSCPNKRVGYGYFHPKYKKSGCVFHVGKNTCNIYHVNSHFSFVFGPVSGEQRQLVLFPVEFLSILKYIPMAMANDPRILSINKVRSRV